MARIREQGFYLSRGELESDIDAAAVPVFDGDGNVVASLALVGSRNELDSFGERRLHTLLAKAAGDIPRRASPASKPVTHRSRPGQSRVDNPGLDS